MRDNVAVAEREDVAVITYAHWEVSLPRSFLAAHAPLQELLTRRRSRADLPQHPEYDDLVRLLEAQGCFTSTERYAFYPLREVRRLFDPLRSAWYAAYYAHPLWGRLRTGTATRNELLAWVIHNYHISRAAGVVGARLAATAPEPAWRAFFRQDTLEEYWHCDAFYFVRHPSLAVADDEVKGCVPLPSTFAFETHTLQVAERNPLAHLLIAYFQESSIAFYDDCLRFYEQVERAYNLPGFFRTWQQHMRLDQVHGHATGLADLFAHDTHVSAAAVDVALRDAWLAYWFLLRSLNDIEGEALADGRLRLRLPVCGGTVDPSRSSFMGESIETWSFPSGASLADLCRGVAALGWSPGAAEAVAVTDRDAALVLTALTDACHQALSRVRDHDQIVLLGHVCQAVQQAAAAEQPSDGIDCPWAAAVASVLREASVRPTECLSLASLLGSVYGAASPPPAVMRPFTGAWVDRADRFLSHVPVAAVDADVLLTRLLQFRELLTLWLVRSDRFDSAAVAL